MDKNRGIFFFIGTEAELIKLFPIILQCKENNVPYYIIASGQNDITVSRIVKELDLPVDLELSREETIKKNAVGLFMWLVKTMKTAKKRIQNKFVDVRIEGSVMVVHGDTVSTVIGALLGRRLGMQVCHVEAGLRSHNFMNPFPEEIDRRITGKMSDYHFAPGEEPYQNLSKAKGIVIQTYYNTILDSLRYSKNMPVLSNGVIQLQGVSYFVFIMHRQENLLNKDFVQKVVYKVREHAKKRKCVLILHKLTELRFRELGLLDEIKQNSNFILLPRVEYFDFMKVLDQAEYVITDGGSNQEELYYMGKPCLILRKTTERKDGLGQNAVMFMNDLQSIDTFTERFEQYRKKPIRLEMSPSRIIYDTILSVLQEK